MISLSKHCISFQAVSHQGNPIPYQTFKFYDQSGNNLGGTNNIYKTDVNGMLVLPLENHLLSKRITGVPLSNETKRYNTVQQHFTIEDENDKDWTFVMDWREEERFCDPLESSGANIDYTAVQSVFDEMCIGCHNPENPSTTLDLNKEVSYEALYGQYSKQAPDRILVDPIHSADSYLLEKLNCLKPTFGYWMPSTSRGLMPEDKRQLIVDWVLNGQEIGQGEK